MVLALIGVAALFLVAGFFLAREYRSQIAPVWNPSLRAFRVLRLVASVFLAWGLLVSGRTVLQAIALLVMVFAGLYLALESPHSWFTD